MKMPNSDSSTSNELWREDALDSCKFSLHLEEILLRVAKRERYQKTSLVVGLDAGWGQGKTYLLTNWAKQLESNDRPVVYFDAWKNDFNTDAFSAFLSEFHDAVFKLLRKAGLYDEIEVRADVEIGRVKKLAKPFGKLIAKGLLKKVVGLDLEDLSELGRDGVDVLSESALDVLEEQKQRREVLDSVKLALRAITKVFTEKYRGFPLLVMIDELDRCRPTHALEILETVKHLFDVPGICFVVATNIDQLGKSVGAVYGERFDSLAYLTRFFDLQLSLPRSSKQKYIDSLFAEFGLDKETRFHPGLPGKSMTGIWKYPANQCFRCVSDAFDLSLRDLRQVTSIVDTACALMKFDVIHAFPLFFLACLKHKAPEFVIEIMNANDAQQIQQQINWAYEKKLFDNVLVTGNIPYGDVPHLETLIQSYFSASRYTADELNRLRFEPHESPIDSCIAVLLTEMTDSQFQGKPSSLHAYPQLVMQAGFSSRSYHTISHGYL